MGARGVGGGGRGGLAGAGEHGFFFGGEGLSACVCVCMMRVGVRRGMRDVSERRLKERMRRDVSLIVCPWRV